MSVINKMLRDLDSRPSASPNPAQAQALRSGMAIGARLVPEVARQSGFLGASRWRVVAATLTLLAGCAAGGWWYLHQAEAIPRKVVQPQQLVTPIKIVPVVSVAPSVQPVLVVSLPLVVAPLPLPVKTVKPVVERAESTLKMDTTFKWSPRPDGAASVPVAVRAAPPSPVQGATPEATQGVPRRLPALELLSQAQSLWRLGSREAAVAMLREALVVAERDHLTGTVPTNHLVLSSLAREMARMELAEGQVKEALAMLTRLEPALSGVADVWALRGNAAQRLGRHEESAAAYLQALKLRPNEPRWMLGAAVSLAAQGQISAATELAEKARVAGVLTPEVTAYLKQLGVNLPER